MSVKTIIISAIFSIFYTGVNAQNTFEELTKLGNQQVDLGNSKAAMEYFDEALKVGTQDSSKVVWTALLAGSCAIELNMDKKAMEYQSLAFKYGCKDIPIIDQQIELAKKNKNLEVGEEALLYARSLEGNYEKYTIKLLYFYYNSKQYSKTIQTADEVLEFRPLHSKASYFKGIACVKLEKTDEAIVVFEELLNNEPENEKVSLQLGLVYFNRANEVYNRADNKYAKISNPSREDYKVFMGQAKKSEPDYKKCLPLLEKVYKSKQKEDVKKAIDLAKQRIRLMNIYSN